MENKMKIFQIQYSRPTRTKIAVSDWLEYSTKIKANTIKEAMKNFKKKQETRGGTYLFLDCYEY